MCLGNICRSPMAEAVFKHLISQKSLSNNFHIESAGTGGWHSGQDADHRTLSVLREKGILFKHRARKIREEDFYSFDLILAMDAEVLSDLKRIKPDDSKSELHLMCKWDLEEPNRPVEDPYYGNINDFRVVYELIKTNSILWLDKLI